MIELILALLFQLSALTGTTDAKVEKNKTKDNSTSNTNSATSENTNLGTSNTATTTKYGGTGTWDTND